MAFAAMKSEDNQAIGAFCRELGFPLFGVADIVSVRDQFLLPSGLRSRFSRAVVLAKQLSNSVLDDIENHPTPLYFHHYRQVNYFLDRAAFLLAGRFQDLGFEALAIPASQIIDWENQLAHVPHKKIACLAGLGWIGRHNLLVTPQFGARVRLVTVLTEMPLEPTGPPRVFGCGTCRRCIAPCPAAAIGEDPANFEHRLCYAKLEEFRRQHLVSQHICGVCVKACRGPFLV